MPRFAFLEAAEAAEKMAELAGGIEGIKIGELLNT